jgi:hypothetical protein
VRIARTLRAGHEDVVGTINRHLIRVLQAGQSHQNANAIVVND